VRETISERQHSIADILRSVSVSVSTKDMAWTCRSTKNRRCRRRWRIKDSRSDHGENDYADPFRRGSSEEGDHSEDVAWREEDRTRRGRRKKRLRRRQGLLYLLRPSDDEAGTRIRTLH